MKVVRQLNLGKKEKIDDRGVTLSNSQEATKKLRQTSIPPPIELLCLLPNEKIFKTHVRQRFIYQSSFCSYSTNLYI